jgi:phenylalanyl-tRNA synthetase beta chain
LTSEESLRKAGVWNDAIVPLRVSNPMSVDVQCMRTSLRPSLLRTVAGNVRRQERPLRLFEVGRVYMPQKGDLPDERETAVVVLAGSRFPTSWLTPDERVDFYDAKGIVEALLTGIGLKGTFQAADSAGLHPGKTAKIIVSKIEVGIVGEVHPTILGAFDLDDVPVAIAEIDIGRLLNATGMTTQQFKPIPRFPSAVRDISILVDSSVPGTEIQEAILQQGLVARVTLFDVYEGERLSKGQRSLAFRIHFQSSTRTLTTEDVTRAMDGVVQMIGKQFGARLRQ